ncbi:MAG: branched-chain amino acid transport system II carrier protein [Eggerthella lenta]
MSSGRRAVALRPGQLLAVGGMLFSMFFGAGNLILPPLLGLQAGDQAIPAMTGFLIAGIGLPVLGIVAVAVCGGVRELAGRVSPLFASVFIALMYLTIGPFLAIPRTSSTAFEMLRPLLPVTDAAGLGVATAAFSVAFFGVAFALALRPGLLSRVLGRFSAPALILLIVLVVGASVLAARARRRLRSRPMTRARCRTVFSRGTRPWTCWRRCASASWWLRTFASWA